MRICKYRLRSRERLHSHFFTSAFAVGSVQWQQLSQMRSHLSLGFCDKFASSPICQFAEMSLRPYAIATGCRYAAVTTSVASAFIIIIIMIITVVLVVVAAAVAAVLAGRIIFRSWSALGWANFEFSLWPARERTRHGADEWAFERDGLCKKMWESASESASIRSNNYNCKSNSNSSTKCNISSDISCASI